MQKTQISIIPIPNPGIANRLLKYEIRQIFTKKSDFYYVRSSESDDVFNTSITFDIEHRLFCKVSGIKAMCAITTYHDACGIDRFAPSLMEVLYQIPKNLIDKVFAFEITQHIISEGEILCDQDKRALKAGYLIGDLTLFSKK